MPISSAVRRQRRPASAEPAVAPARGAPALPAGGRSPPLPGRPRRPRAGDSTPCNVKRGTTAVGGHPGGGEPPDWPPPPRRGGGGGGAKTNSPVSRKRVGRPVLAAKSAKTKLKRGFKMGRAKNPPPM